MAKFRFAISHIQYGYIDVEADNLEEAENKAYQLEGETHYHSDEVPDALLMVENSDNSWGFEVNNNKN